MGISSLPLILGALLASFGARQYVSAKRGITFDLARAKVINRKILDENDNVYPGDAGYRKVYPVEIYLSAAAFQWGGVLNQASGTLTERIAALRSNNKLWVNRDTVQATPKSYRHLCY